MVPGDKQACNVNTGHISSCKSVLSGAWWLEVQSAVVGGAVGGGWRCRGRWLEVHSAVVQREVVGGT